MSFSGTWMEYKIIRLKEISQTRKTDIASWNVALKKKISQRGAVFGKRKGTVSGSIEMIMG